MTHLKRFCTRCRYCRIAMMATTLCLVAGFCIAAGYGAEESPVLKQVAKSGVKQAETLQTHSRWITHLSYSKDGKKLATVGGDSLQFRPGDVRIWDSTTGKLLARLDGHQTTVWSCDFSPDGTTLMTSGYDGTVMLWDLGSNKPRTTLAAHKGWCRSARFAPDGSHFATAGPGGEIKIWKTADTRKEVRSVKAHDGAVFQVAFSPDGARLGSAGTDKTARLWDWKTGKELAKLAHDDTVWAIAFSGDRIATAGADRVIKLWDTNGKATGTLPGAKDWITSLAFSTDGRLLSCGTYARTVTVWDVATSKTVASIGDFQASVWSVAFAPGSTRMAAGGHQGPPQILDVRPAAVTTKVKDEKKQLPLDKHPGTKSATPKK